MKKNVRCPSCKEFIGHFAEFEIDSILSFPNGQHHASGQTCFCCPACDAVLGFSPSLISDIEGYTCNIESNIESSLGELKKSLDGLKQAVEKLGGGVRKKKA